MGETGKWCQFPHRSQWPRPPNTMRLFGARQPGAIITSPYPYGGRGTATPQKPGEPQCLLRKWAYLRSEARGGGPVGGRLRFTIDLRRFHKGIEDPAFDLSGLIVW